MLELPGGLLWGWGPAVREIRNLADIYRPALLFLSETKLKSDRAQDLMYRLGYAHAFGVSCTGLSGGLALFWNNNMVVEEGCSNKMWWFTGFYGQPHPENRKESWKLLKVL